MKNTKRPEITVSNHLKWFAKSLQPSITRLNQALAQEDGFYSAVGDAKNIAESFRQCRRLLQQLVTCINAIMEQVIDCPSVDAATVYRFGGQLENIVDSLASLYQEAADQANDSFEENFYLLKNGLQKILRRILDWMEDIYNTIEHPEIYYHPRPQDIRNGHAELSFMLNIEMPDEFELLTFKIRDPIRSNHRSPSFFETVAGVVLGIAISDWLFGDDEN